MLALLDVSCVVHRRPELGEELDDADFRVLYLLLFAFPRILLLFKTYYLEVR